MPTTPARPLAASRRLRWVRIGAAATALTLVWNIAEGAIAVWAGEVADSVALVGFGVNSFIEFASAAVVAWRLLAERRGEAARAERAEKAAGRWMAVLLYLLAIYLVAESARRLAGWGPDARESTIGLVLTGASLIAMPGLYVVKRRVARELASAAVRADGVQTLACFWLSVATFVGLAVNAALGWTWADPLAALVLVPFVIREGRAAWKGEGCGCAGSRSCVGGASLNP